MEVHDDGPPAQLNPVPFAVAAVVVITLAVVAFVFLRPDDAGDLVRPDRLDAIDETTVRATATLPSPCHEVLRAQVDLAEEAIFVELVVEGTGDPCTAVVEAIEVEITLPEPIDGRELRVGVGRFRIPCRGDAPTVTCSVDR